MADIKISALTGASALDGTEEVAIVQTGATVKATTQAIADLGGGGGISTLAEYANQSYVDLMQYNKEWMLPKVGSNAYSISELNRTGSNITLSNNSNSFSYPINVAFRAGTTAGGIAFQRNKAMNIFSGNEFHFTRGFFKSNTVSDERFFIGLSPNYAFSSPTNIEPDTETSCIGVGKLSTSDNLHIIHNDGTGTATTYDLGASYPANDIALYYYRLEIYGDLSSSVTIKVTRITRTDGTEISTSQTTATDIVTTTTYPLLWVTNNATAAEASIEDRGVILLTKTF